MYIAGSWGRQEELRKEEAIFNTFGVHVTSRWLHEPGSVGTPTPEYLKRTAQDDIDDLDRSNVLVLYSNGRGSETIGGGRFFEAGYMFHRNLPIITVGEREMIFQYLSETDLVYQVDDTHGAITLLGNWELELAQLKLHREEQQETRSYIESLRRSPVLPPARNSVSVLDHTDFNHV